MALEEYRSRFVALKIAYLELLEAPQRSTTALHIHDRLFTINDDLLQFAEDLTRDIRAMQALLTGRSGFPDSDVPAYQQLLLDANTLAQRVNASLRQTNRFIQQAQPLVGASPTYNQGSRSNH